MDFETFLRRIFLLRGQTYKVLFASSLRQITKLSHLKFQLHGIR